LNTMLELNGKTVCILGCGSVGTECAKRLKAFGCKVIGADIVNREHEIFDQVVLINDVQIVLRQTDVLIITMPLTEKTVHFIDKQKIERLKPQAIVVNIARGKIIDELALIEALENRRLGGAVLDVFEEEPLDESSPIWNMDNVVLTPHNCFIGEGNASRLDKVIFKGLYGL